MAVFLILYECTWAFSTMPPVYFLLEPVLPVNEGESVRGGNGAGVSSKGQTAPLVESLSCVIPTFLPFLIPVIIFQRF